MTLTEFVLARLADDHAAAVQAALERAGSAHRVGKTDAVRRVRDVEAKRRIVELHRATLSAEVHQNGRWDADASVMIACQYWYCATCDHDRDYGFTGGPDEGCDTLRALARPYDDHPDFDPAWAA